MLELLERLAAVGTPPRLLAAAVLLLVATFCWCWRERCRRRSIKDIEQQRHEQRLELLQEYADLFSEAKLVADDLPLIAHLELTEPRDEIEPPTVSREADS